LSPGKYAGYVGLIINCKKTEALFLNCEQTSVVVLEEEVAQVEDFCYLGSMISSPLRDLRRRRGIARSAFWKLETVWRSQSLNLETKLRLFDSLVLSVMLYGAESWPVSTQMNQLINSFATSAYRIMTGVKQLYKVRNTNFRIMQIGNGTPLSTRREWKKAQDHGHHGESSQRTSAVYPS